MGLNVRSFAIVAVLVFLSFEPSFAQIGSAAAATATTTTSPQNIGEGGGDKLVAIASSLGASKQDPAVIGVAIGLLVALCALAGIGYFLIHKKSVKSATAEGAESSRRNSKVYPKELPKVFDRSTIMLNMLAFLLDVVTQLGLENVSKWALTSTVIVTMISALLNLIQGYANKEYKLNIFMGTSKHEGYQEITHGRQFIVGLLCLTFAVGGVATLFYTMILMSGLDSMDQVKGVGGYILRTLVGLFLPMAVTFFPAKYLQSYVLDEKFVTIKDWIAWTFIAVLGALAITAWLFYALYVREVTNDLEPSELSKVIPTEAGWAMLVLGILIRIGVIMFLFRDKLKASFNNLKQKFADRNRKEGQELSKSSKVEPDKSVEGAPIVRHETTKITPPKKDKKTR